jgi:hypothetical protein
MNACDYCPASWPRAILEEHVKGRSKRLTWAYLTGILRRCLEQGECSALKKQTGRPKGSLAPAKPAVITQFTDEERAAMQQRRANQRAKAAEGKS